MMVNSSSEVEKDVNEKEMSPNESEDFPLAHDSKECPNANEIFDITPDEQKPKLFDNVEEDNERKKSLFCSFPLEKVQEILTKCTPCRSEENRMKVNRKVFCLYCDRTFVNVNLRQKHVERCHSSKQLRRVSLRKHQNFITNTTCNYCDKFVPTGNALEDLFRHLVKVHSDKYFGCLTCEMRFLNSSHLVDHNVLCHNLITPKSDIMENNIKESLSNSSLNTEEEFTARKYRRKAKNRKVNSLIVSSVTDTEPLVSTTDESIKSPKKLRNTKLAVKSSRMVVKRSKRLQAKINIPNKKKYVEGINERKKSDRLEQTFSSRLIDKSNKSTSSSFVNPYPEFDSYFQVKKITDHSIDNLKISSLTFDDVFDKAFFNRIKCNIQENLLNHIDGKLFKNEESENRISNFEKTANVVEEPQNISENYGCELSINAIAPTTFLLCNQLGDDPESQIEYGSKPSKKKPQIKKDEVHYKYFTRRKYQASILERKENRDLSKLDMWTQYLIKNRQQKIIDDKKSPKEILDYFNSEEYKNIMRRDELNRILDRRGPYEDLREEADKKAALDKLNGEHSPIDCDNFIEIRELLNDMLTKVFELCKESVSEDTNSSKNLNHTNEANSLEIPSYLNLRPSLGVSTEGEIDRSDKIALICSSQETENFEDPNNTVRGKDEKVELTGEWTRSRIFVCAACGLKLQNIKQFLEHKSASHQYIWVQHYEFVGNQSELYRHLSIPVLGKVGVLENTIQCKVWKRSDARLCTKCGKQCNSLGELHRHILECGGDWTWMLARKKCKYRPFGAKSRRKRRGLVKRIYPQKTESSEKKVYKKSYEMPRQKPSDADTIKRMLANLPAKRTTRKVISLKDGYNSTNKQIKRTKQSKFRCGKLICNKTKQQNVNQTEVEKVTTNQNNNSHRRSLRSLNKVLTSRILDTNSSLIVRRKYSRKLKMEDKKVNDSHPSVKNQKNLVKRKDHLTFSKVAKKKNNVRTQVQKSKQVQDEIKPKRCSPRIEKRLAFNAGNDKMNIKRFFPVKKKVNNSIVSTNSVPKGQSNSDDQNSNDISLPENNDENCTLRKRKNDNNKSESSFVKKTKTRKSLLNSSSSKSKNEDDLPAVSNFENVEKNDEDTLIKNENNEDKLTEISQKISDDLNSQISESKTEENADFLNLKVSRGQNKGRIKRPSRGLNDCIAMLTSKLSKNLQESGNALNKITENTECETKSEAACILKIPFSTEHFHLSVKNTEIKNVDNLVRASKLFLDQNDPHENSNAIKNDNELEESKNPIDKENSEMQKMEIVISNVKVSGEPDEISEEHSTISNSTNSDEFRKDVDVKNTDIRRENPETDSEDEIPLSVLLKDEQDSQSMSSLNTSNKSPEIGSTENSLTTAVLSVSFNQFNISSNSPSLRETENIAKPEENAFRTEEKSNSIEKGSKKKDSAVLMEINDNFEHIESLAPMNVLINDANKIDQINRKTFEKKIDDLLFVSSELILQSQESTNKLNSLSDIKDVDDSSIPLDDQFENHVITKFNVFSKNCLDHVNKMPIIDINGDDLLNSDLSLDENKKIKTCTLEYKENSILVMEDPFIKPKKEKKKPSVSNRSFSRNRNLEVLNKNDPEILNGKNVLHTKTNDLEQGFLDRMKCDRDKIENDDQILLEKKNVDSPSKDICLTTDKEKKSDKAEDHPKDNISSQQDSSQESVEDAANRRELRRSLRNSKKVLYNETDLIDPLLDDLDNDRTISKILKETTKDIFGIKRRARRSLDNKKTTKIDQKEKRLNGEELFDLLKSSTNDSSLSKPTSFNSFEQNSSNDFNDDNFDMLEDILEKSMASIEENLSESTVQNEVSESNAASEITELKNNRFSRRNRRTKYKNKSIIGIDKNPIVQKVSERCDSAENNDVNSNEMSQGNINKLEVAENKDIYCEICNKSFCRMKSLIKHKRTLTHISKLSELEAKEAAERTKSISCDSGNVSNKLDVNESIDAQDSKQFSSTLDIDVNYADHNKSEIKENDSTQRFQENEIRRYKSLGERKSFESEECTTSIKDSSNVKNDYFESEISISNVATGSILEKQISLLENIIENRSQLSYIDELSTFSNDKPNFANEVKQVNGIRSYLDGSVKECNIISNVEDNFLKPTQYEEVSEDSSLKNYDEQKLRKALNRDEELFLECCSLLKSSSEVSNYSKLSNNVSKDVQNLKNCTETDWLENNYSSQKDNDEFVECYSDNSRIQTPLGLSPDHSNSSSNESQFELDHTLPKELNLEENLNSPDSLSFKRFFNKKEENEQRSEELLSSEHSFDGILPAITKNEECIKIRNNSDVEELSDVFSEENDLKNLDGKKLLTKGAMKVFEGLKVSIPTQELNIDKILVSGSPVKSEKEIEMANIPKTKDKNSSKTKRRSSKVANFKNHNFQKNLEVHDVYDFEETQDNSDVFMRPDFRTFRTNHEKNKKFEKIDSDDDTRDYPDTLNFDALSSSASSVSEAFPSRTKQNITKKKCMIMGRIFKNAVKSKITEDDIRNIPVVDNTKLVEDFVLNCSEPIASPAEKKPRMTEEELNLAFDELISNKTTETKSKASKACTSQSHQKNGCNRRKQKLKNKKRSHANSDSSDDEFKLQKPANKRPKKKNTNTEKSCINLEQELRECIGVASRKSQRKCTSGKQKVLMEYWSSDESSTEAVFEKPTSLVQKSNESIHISKTPLLNDLLLKECQNSNSAIKNEIFEKEFSQEKTSSSANRRKRVAVNPLYHWSSSSEDETHDIIPITPARDEFKDDDDDDRPIQHGWIVGDSPKKLVTMLAQAKGKKSDVDGVKEESKKRTSVHS